MKFPILIVPALVLAGCANDQYSAAASDRAKIADLEVEEKLEGYTLAGTRNCLPSRFNSSLQVHDNREALVRQGRSYFRQTLGQGCRDASDFHTTLVTESTTGNMCQGDIVRVVDSATGMFSGSCALGEWAEYRRDNSDS